MSGELLGRPDAEASGDKAVPEDIGRRCSEILRVADAKPDTRNEPLGSALRLAKAGEPGRERLERAGLALQSDKIPRAHWDGSLTQLTSTAIAAAIKFLQPQAGSGCGACVAAMSCSSIWFARL